jgi:hypothetical protein
MRLPIGARLSSLRKVAVVSGRDGNILPAVRCLGAAGWSEAQKRAYVLADNQLAITGSEWDPELLLRTGSARWRDRGGRRAGM